MAQAGYSGTPLIKKLGIKENFKVLVHNYSGSYEKLLDGIPESVRFGGRAPFDVIHFFTDSRKQLERQLPKLKKRVRQNGMIWVSWPKKASQVPTDVTGDVVRGTALGLGLVDVKVCAVDQVWSGLKLVIPVKDRC